MKIALMGHPVLRRRAQSIADPAAAEVRRLIGDMVETMVDADGMGLAAPQVHAPLRLVAFQVPAQALAQASTETDAAVEDPPPLQILINPTVEPLTEQTAFGWEGCLSVPGLRGRVPRYTAVRYRATAPDGGTLSCECEGMHARVVQHECDHLNGILYPMRMTDLSDLVFESEFKYRIAAEEAPAEPVAAFAD